MLTEPLAKRLILAGDPPPQSEASAVPGTATMLPQLLEAAVAAVPIDEVEDRMLQGTTWTTRWTNGMPPVAKKGRLQWPSPPKIAGIEPLPLPQTVESCC